MKNTLLLFFASLLLTCNKDQPEPTTEFELNKNKWEALGVDSYSFTLQISCFCTEETTRLKAVKIVNNQITLVNETPYNSDEHWGVMTISQLFDEIENAERDKVFLLRVEYDQDKGFPNSVYIDREEMMADEEMGYTITNLKY
jgi:hypothetical protein